MRRNQTINTVGFGFPRTLCICCAHPQQRLCFDSAQRSSSRDWRGKIAISQSPYSKNLRKTQTSLEDVCNWVYGFVVVVINGTASIRGSWELNVGANIFTHFWRSSIHYNLYISYCAYRKGRHLQQRSVVPQSRAVRPLPTALYCLLYFMFSDFRVVEGSILFHHARS